MDVLPFYPKTDSQEDLWTSLNKHTVSIAVGPAGVGKTLVALWWGLAAVKARGIEKIIYIRSDVGCAHQRGRGALPGTLEEKMAPLVGPVMDNLAVMCKSHGAAEYLTSKGIIESMMLRMFEVEVSTSVLSSLMKHRILHQTKSKPYFLESVRILRLLSQATHDKSI